jgi:N-hydroxyarylamine O-acetyltransferase
LKVMQTTINLPAYFGRIGYTGPCEPTLSVLIALHTSHTTQIPFEGLDPFLRRPVLIDERSIQSKMIDDLRGGYCHEQNALFFWVLRAIGFRVTPLGARVVWMSPGRSPPLTHRLTLVNTTEGDYFADVGFGGQTYTAPIRLELGTRQTTLHGDYRVLEDNGVFEIQMWALNRWEGMYRFTLASQSHADFEMANWFTSTHPKTRFVHNLVAARIRGRSRINLLNASLAIHDPLGTERRDLTGPRELCEALEQLIGITLPVSAEEIWARLPDKVLPHWP